MKFLKFIINDKIILKEEETAYISYLAARLGDSANFEPTK